MNPVKVPKPYQAKDKAKREQKREGRNSHARPRYLKLEEWETYSEEYIRGRKAAKPLGEKGRNYPPLLVAIPSHPGPCAEAGDSAMNMLLHLLLPARAFGG
jgi:hypothetical protein